MQFHRVYYALAPHEKELHIQEGFGRKLMGHSIAHINTFAITKCIFITDSNYRLDSSGRCALLWFFI